MNFKRLLFIPTMSFLLFSCNDKNSSYVQVKSIESEIYNSVKAYRESNHQTGPFVHQYLMVEEAQLWSYNMAAGLVPLGTQGLDEHWARLDEKYTFYNRSGLVMKSASQNGEQILTELLFISGADSILLSDVTQCGVGVETDADGINFITILLAKADS